MAVYWTVFDLMIYFNIKLPTTEFSLSFSSVLAGDKMDIEDFSGRGAVGNRDHSEIKIR